MQKNYALLLSIALFTLLCDALAASTPKVKDVLTPWEAFNEALSDANFKWRQFVRAAFYYSAFDETDGPAYDQCRDSIINVFDRARDSAAWLKSPELHSAAIAAMHKALATAVETLNKNMHQVVLLQLRAELGRCDAIWDPSHWAIDDINKCLGKKNRYQMPLATALLAQTANERAVAFHMLPGGGVGIFVAPVPNCAELMKGVVAAGSWVRYDP